MPEEVPFVDRESPLQTLREGLNPEEHQLYVVYGDSGVGKSRLLDEFREECEEDGHLTLDYVMDQPRSDEVFLQRVASEWTHKHPEPVAERLRRYVSDSVSLDDLLAAAQALTADPASSFTVDKIRRMLSEHTGSDGIDIPDPVRLTTDLMNDVGTPEQPAIVTIDQYDSDPYTEQVATSFTNAFQDVAGRLADSVLWYVASDIGITGDGIKPVPIAPFDPIEPGNPGASYQNDDVSFGQVHQGDQFTITRDFVETLGFDYDQPDIAELYEYTQGLPLLLVDFYKNTDSLVLREALSEYTGFRRRQRELRQQFFTSMTEDEREFLKQTAILPRILSEVATELVGTDVFEVEAICDRLVERGQMTERWLDRIEQQSYKVHDFYRNYLLNRYEEDIPDVRQEAATTYLDLAHEEFFEDTDAEPSMLSPLAQRYVDGFSYQLNQLRREEELQNIVEAVLSRTSCSEEEVIRLLSEYPGLTIPSNPDSLLECVESTLSE